MLILKTFNTRNEAEAVQAILSGSGVEAFVQSDDCGAVDPALAFGRGVQLLVAEEDAERAAEIVEQMVPDDEPE